MRRGILALVLLMTMPMTGRAEVCVVPFDELGLDGSNVQVLQHLTEFMLRGPRPAVGIPCIWNHAAIEAAVSRTAVPVAASSSQ